MRLRCEWLIVCGCVLFVSVTTVPTQAQQSEEPQAATAPRSAPTAPEPPSDSHPPHRDAAEIVAMLRDAIDHRVRLQDEQWLVALNRSVDDSGPMLRENVDLFVSIATDRRHDPVVRCEAIDLVGRVARKSDPITSALKELLDADGHLGEFYAVHAAGALLRIDPASATGIAALLEQLEDARPHVRWMACRRLGDVEADPEQCLAKLRGRLTDDHVSVRVSAARAISHITGKAEKEIIDVAAQSMYEEGRPVWLTPPSFGDWGISHQVLAADLLARFGGSSEEAVAALIHGTRDADPIVQLASAKALGRVRPLSPAVERRLQEMASESIGPVREAVHQILERTPGSEPK